MTTNNHIKDPSNVKTSAYVSSNSTQWLTNTGFDDSGENWTSLTTGDSTDVDATISGGEARLMVKGNISTYSDISGIPQSGDWTPINNTEVKYEPDSYEINSKGCWVSHTWSDGADTGQVVAIQWDRNITLAVDMTDYNITSVSLTVTANATVHANNGANGGIEVKGEQQSGWRYENATGDWVLFYAYISDINKNQEHEIAYLKPDDLGNDTSGTYDTLDDTNLTVISEDSIMNLMKSVLEVDPEHKTFILSLGILVLSEDDFDTDQDIWDELIINYCDFSFTYEKIIDPLSGVSWSQEGKKISDLSDEYYVQVTGAIVNFCYKIDQDWPTSSSPNSEIRILINNNPHAETIKLINANYDYQNASAIGLNVLALITEEVNFSIQIYMRDEFGLNETITISIDNVSLIISYDFLTIEVIPPWGQTFGWLVAVLAIGLAAVGSYFIAYQMYLKYPKFVRLLRSLRKRVKKGRSLKNPVIVNSREKMVMSSIKEKMKVLNVESSGIQAGATIKKISGGVK